MKGFSKSTLAPLPQSNSSMGSVGIFAMDDVWGEVGAALLDRVDNDGKLRLEVPADKGASGWLGFSADNDGKQRLEVPTDKGTSGWLGVGFVGWLAAGCVGWLEVPSGVEASASSVPFLSVRFNRTFPSRCLLAYSRAMRLQACEKLRATTFMLPSNPS